MTRTALWISCSLLLGTGCGGTDEPAVEDTDVIPAPTFTEVRDEILVPSCGFSTCHGSAGDAGGLTFLEDDGADVLVDVPSTVLPSEILVIANDPDGSYLVKKLIGDVSIDGDPMPPPLGGLPADEEQMIRDWIADGAPDN